MLGEVAAARLPADIPSDRIFSATELEGYAYCPYRYFLSRVLNVQPLEEAELEVDYMQRGQTAHALLADFHRRVNRACGEAASPAALAEADYDRLLAEAVAANLSQPGRDSLADTLREIDRRILLQWLEGYRQQHEKYDAQWEECDRPPRPALFEVSFGRSLREGDGPPSTDEPFKLASRGQVVRLAGRIDRIDLGQVGGQAIFNILDYKTGGGVKFSLEACQRGTVLQLPLYALAAGELIVNDRNAVPWQAGYWYVKDDGFKPRQALRMYEQVDDHVGPSEAWETIRSTLADTVVGLVTAMRQGQFPVWSDDPNCTGRCPYSTVCRINQIRSLEKKWRPAGV
jgi:ATP-dependent helicase/DNAse subunit B